MMSKIVRAALAVGTWLGSVLIMRWTLGIGKPHRDTQVVRDAVQDVRYYWRHREALLHRLRVRATYELGIADTNLRILKLRIAGGAYADDVGVGMGGGGEAQA